VGSTDQNVIIDLNSTTTAGGWDLNPPLFAGKPIALPKRNVRARGALVVSGCLFQYE